MRKWLAMLRPNPWLARRLVMLAILVGVGVAVLVIILLASLISIRRVLVLEPAIVFKGG